MTPAAPASVTTPAPRAASVPPVAAKPADATTLLANVLTRNTRRDIILSRVQPNGSLRPYFDENAVLMLESVPYAELRVGDVVTFFHPQLNAVVVHRLVEKRDGMFWSRADRSAGAEAVHVTPENYRRRLVGVVYVNPQPAGNGPGTTSRPATYAAQPD
ncbi:hypothetical protein [Opitutus sp. ER46]|uniref:hypothetical protein n=1 Tax=Opitutus sp. ER46 TaxID=2161864 RepID=UPI0018EE7EC5|nr:hypothetical protein [Opitutus sp. ER46]